MTTFLPMIGDRVRFARDLGGHLKKGEMGIVVDIYPDPEDGSKPRLNLLVAIPWVREKHPVDGKPWDGRIEGHPPVPLSQFFKGCVIPMDSDELEYIDNVGGGRR